ncbi:hypothetical protein MYA83_12730 [Pseudomonas palleroniana]|uniref:hypothetical protein n=1 Tax=Pseudomonas palleroniana TaxID=191390 RepID=UPI003B006BAF
MSNGQTIFPYLLITQHTEVGMSAALFAEGRFFQTDDSLLYSFLSTKPFAEINEELKKFGKEYALVLAEDYAYANANGKLARVFDHLK